MCIQVSLKAIDREYRSEIKIIDLIFLNNDNDNNNNNNCCQALSMGIEEFADFEKIIFLSSSLPSSTKLDCTIGKYYISLYNTLATMRITENDVILFEMTIDKWRDFFYRFHSVIVYKLNFLEKYRDYANVIHRRLVSYYVGMLKEKEEKGESRDFFTYDYLSTHIIKLENCVLPCTEDSCNYAVMDYNFCFLINAEIRFNMSYIIFLDVLSHFTQDALTRICNDIIID